MSDDIIFIYAVIRSETFITWWNSEWQNMQEELHGAGKNYRFKKGTENRGEKGEAEYNYLNP